MPRSSMPTEPSPREPPSSPRAPRWPSPRPAAPAPPRAAELAAGAGLAVVVVGTTRADEGEFIGDSGTTHLQALLPGPDEPEGVAAFEARLPDGPAAVAGAGAGAGG